MFQTEKKYIFYSKLTPTVNKDLIMIERDVTHPNAASHEHQRRHTKCVKCNVYLFSFY